MQFSARDVYAISFDDSLAIVKTYSINIPVLRIVSDTSDLPGNEVNECMG